MALEDGLDRDPAAEARIEALVDDAHRALAEDALDAVAAQRFGLTRHHAPLPLPRLMPALPVLRLHRREFLQDVHAVGAAGKLIHTMEWNERIVIDPAILAGKPVIRGTRLAVDFVLGLLARGWTEADIQRNYPAVSHDDIVACLQYASETLQAEKVYPLNPAGTV